MKIALVNLKRYLAVDLRGGYFVTILIGLLRCNVGGNFYQITRNL